MAEISRDGGCRCNIAASAPRPPPLLFMRMRCVSHKHFPPSLKTCRACNIAEQVCLLYREGWGHWGGGAELFKLYTISLLLVGRNHLHRSSSLRSWARAPVHGVERKVTAASSSASIQSRERVRQDSRQLELYGLYLDFIRRVCQSNQGLERGR